MPDNFQDNPLLENWSRHQITYHLKQARLEYHRTGTCPKLTFKSVYGEAGDSASSYLDNSSLSQDHIGVMGQCNAVRSVLTFRIIMQRQWNNLRSPANPRNYFHGKLMPTGVDEAGNLVYVYNPMEYERRWAAEGIDLSVK